MSEIVYKIWRKDGLGVTRQHPVSGLQIGRFAIRNRTDDDMTAYTAKGNIVPVASRLVDHINTGIIVIDIEDFHDALIIADDLSRFSRKDPSAKDHRKFFDQIGPFVIQWLTSVIKNRKVVGYRDYYRSLNSVSNPAHARN